jgi:hypothetical protein
MNFADDALEFSACGRKQGQHVPKGFIEAIPIHGRQYWCNILFPIKIANWHILFPFSMTRNKIKQCISVLKKRKEKKRWKDTIRQRGYTIYIK